MTVTKIYLTRHGETEWNVEGRLQGRKDSPLTERGRLQASWLSEALSDIEIETIYSSSSKRTMDTAEIIRGIKNTTVIPNDNLREINMSEWEGQINEEVQMNYPDSHFNFWNNPHVYKPISGESFIDVQNRVIPEINKILDEHKGKNILIVTHAVSLKAIMSHFENRPLSELWSPPFIHPTSLSMVEIDEKGLKIHLYGDIAHYQE